MGLSIHYKLGYSGSAEGAKAVLEKLRQWSMDQSFETVSEVAHFTGAECNHMKNNNDEWSWARVQSQISVKLTERSSMFVPPVEAFILSTWPGEGCEEANFGLCRYPVNAVYQGVKYPTHKGTGWHWKSFCKTQYAGQTGLLNFLRCHTLVISALDKAKELGILRSVDDEGEFWEKRNLKALAEEVGEWDQMIAGMSGMLSQKLGKGQSMESPIQQYGRYDILKEKGFKHLQGFGKALGLNDNPVGKICEASGCPNRSKGGRCMLPRNKPCPYLGAKNPVMKLMTKEIYDKMPPLYSQENVKDPIVRVKFFYPAGSSTWGATEGSEVCPAHGNFDCKECPKPWHDYMFFGWATHGDGGELGYFSLKELASVRGRFGLGIERDKYFDPMPLSKFKGQYPNPISQFKCSICGAEAPKNLLRTGPVRGQFQKRMSWLRNHRKKFHYSSFRRSVRKGVATRAGHPNPCGKKNPRAEKGMASDQLKKELSAIQPTIDFLHDVVGIGRFAEVYRTSDGFYMGRDWGDIGANAFLGKPSPIALHRSVGYFVKLSPGSQYEVLEILKDHSIPPSELGIRANKIVIRSAAGLEHPELNNPR